MKIIIYYLVLLVFIALIAGYLIMGNPTDMAMQQMVTISFGLVLYTLAISLVGEGKLADERDQHHRYLSNRAGLIAGTITLCAAIIYQLLTHNLDYWLLVGLIAINLTKIVSLIYLNYKR